MKTPAHILVSAILAALFYPIFKSKAALILAGGVLIDIDHYLWYVFKYKKFGLAECYSYFTIEAEKNKWKDIIGIFLIFHTIEFVILMIALSFYSKLALIFSIGLLSHYVLDAIFIASVPKRIILNHSIISWIVKNKK